MVDIDAGMHPDKLPATQLLVDLVLREPARPQLRPGDDAVLDHEQVPEDLLGEEPVAVGHARHLPDRAAGNPTRAVLWRTPTDPIRGS